MRAPLPTDKTFFNCKIWGEKKETILVSPDRWYRNAVSLPKNQISFTPTWPKGQRGYANIGMSASLARDKGFTNGR